MVMEKSGAGSPRSSFCLEHVIFEIPISPSSGDVEDIVGYTSLEV